VCGAKEDMFGALLFLLLPANAEYLLSGKRSREVYWKDCACQGIEKLLLWDLLPKLDRGT